MDHHELNSLAVGNLRFRAPEDLEWEHDVVDRIAACPSLHSVQKSDVHRQARYQRGLPLSKRPGPGGDRPRSFRPSGPLLGVSESPGRRNSFPLM